MTPSQISRATNELFRYRVEREWHTLLLKSPPRNPSFSYWDLSNYGINQHPEDVRPFLRHICEDADTGFDFRHVRYAPGNPDSINGWRIIEGSAIVEDYDEDYDDLGITFLDEVVHWKKAGLTPDPFEEAYFTGDPTAADILTSTRPALPRMRIERAPEPGPCTVCTRTSFFHNSVNGEHLHHSCAQGWES